MNPHACGGAACQPGVTQQPLSVYNRSRVCQQKHGLQKPQQLATTAQYGRAPGITGMLVCCKYGLSANGSYIFLHTRKSPAPNPTASYHLICHLLPVATSAPPSCPHTLQSSNPTRLRPPTHPPPHLHERDLLECAGPLPLHLLMQGQQHLQHALHIALTKVQPADTRRHRATGQASPSAYTKAWAVLTARRHEGAQNMQHYGLCFTNTQ